MSNNKQLLNCGLLIHYGSPNWILAILTNKKQYCVTITENVEKLAFTFNQEESFAAQKSFKILILLLSSSAFKNRRKISFRMVFHTTMFTEIEFFVIFKICKKGRVHRWCQNWVSRRFEIGTFIWKFLGPYGIFISKN